MGFAMVGFGQTTPTNNDLLTAKTWRIHDEIMSGIGVHKSLPKDTEIKFMPDGTWQSTQPIMDTKEGSWKWEDDKYLLMKFGKTEKGNKAKVLQLNDKQLYYQIKDKTATFSFKWNAI